MITVTTLIVAMICFCCCCESIREKIAKCLCRRVLKGEGSVTNESDQSSVRVGGNKKTLSKSILNESESKDDNVNDEKNIPDK